MGRELIQALVNLYEGMAPGTSPTLSQVCLLTIQKRLGKQGR